MDHDDAVFVNGDGKVGFKVLGRHDREFGNIGYVPGIEYAKYVEYGSAKCCFPSIEDKVTGDDAPVGVEVQVRDHSLRVSSQEGMFKGFSS